MISLVFSHDKMKKAKKDRVTRILTLSGGTLGREKLSYVRGQVVSKNYRLSDAQRVNLFTGLCPGEENRLTPFRDIALDPMPFPLIHLEVSDQSGKIVHTDSFPGDKNGFFKYEISRNLKSGDYECAFFIKAEISYYHISETRVIANEHYLLSGKSRLSILPEKSDRIITTSDIDQTYLETPLDSVKGKIWTLFETAANKQQISGMSELYRTLRKKTSGPLTFISASPHFFRRTFFAKFAQDGISAESLHLKYLKGTVQELGKKFRETFSSGDIFSGDWEKKLSELKHSSGKYYRSLFDQVSYKLSILLQNRIYYPTGAREILLGDDTETDYLVYSLYQMIVTGEIAGEELESFLSALEFNGKKAVTPKSAAEIRGYAQRCLKVHGKTNPVISVLINHTDLSKSQKNLYIKMQKALPKKIRINNLDNFRFFTLTDGALGFAAVLHSQGILDADSVCKIAKRIAEDERMDNIRISELFTHLDFLNLGKKTKKLIEKGLGVV